MSYWLVAAALHYIWQQAQSMTPLYGVMISVASLIASGLVHFVVYMRREARQEETLKNLIEDVRNLQTDMRYVRDRVIVIRGKINGEA